jgi:hypothetical protein
MRRLFIISLSMMSPFLSFAHTSRALRTLPDLRASLIRKLTDDTCLEDMRQLQAVADLEIALQLALDDFNRDYEYQPLEYCSSRLNGGRKESECRINFEKFTATYQTMCHDSEAEYTPVSLFMHCYDDFSDLEMELINIPNCLAHSCDDEEISEAVGRVLHEPLTWSNPMETMTCQFFHHTVSTPGPSNIIMHREGFDYDILVLIGAVVLGLCILYILREISKTRKMDSSLEKFLV